MQRPGIFRCQVCLLQLVIPFYCVLLAIRKFRGMFSNKNEVLIKKKQLELLVRKMCLANKKMPLKRLPGYCCFQSACGSHLCCFKRVSLLPLPSFGIPREECGRRGLFQENMQVSSICRIEEKSTGDLQVFQLFVLVPTYLLLEWLEICIRAKIKICLGNKLVLSFCLFACLICLQIKDGHLWNADFCLMEADPTLSLFEREKWGSY